jgi:putative glutamine amidotransferase
MRPTIGVTKPARGELASFWAVSCAVWLAGGRPRRLSAADSASLLGVDGLVLTGGPDVHPPRFQEAPKPDYAYDHAREGLELGLLAAALAADTPVLGICRGAQLMNVAAGGSLHMDVAERFHPTPYPRDWPTQLHFRKRIELAPNSQIAAITGRTRLWVNSIHSQAIDRVGAGLVASAREANGVVQAIERPASRFYVGVQFHPEFLIYRRPFRRLFRALVAAAGDRSGAARETP